MKKYYFLGLSLLMLGTFLAARIAFPQAAPALAQTILAPAQVGVSPVTQQAPASTQTFVATPTPASTSTQSAVSQTPTTNSKKTSACLPQSPYVPKNVDLAKVRAEWIKWYNAARKANGLPAYTYDPNLDRTATLWSDLAKQKGKIAHTRPGQTVYYDYKRMVSWFKTLGLTFPNVKGQTFVENIGWDYYGCSPSAADCTDQMIASIKHTYNFFIGEKNKKYRAHYDSIMGKQFKKIGLGLAVDPISKKYYLTVHYATAVNGTAKNPDGTDVRACTEV